MKIEMSEEASLAIGVTSVATAAVLVALMISSCTVKQSQISYQIESERLKQGHTAVIGYQPVTGWVRTNDTSR